MTTDTPTFVAPAGTELPDTPEAREAHLKAQLADALGKVREVAVEVVEHRATRTPVAADLAEPIVVPTVELVPDVEPKTLDPPVPAAELVAQRAEHELATEPEPPATAPTVQLDHLADVIRAYERAAAESKQWGETAKHLRAIIENALGEREVGTVAGKAAVRWTYVTSNRVDLAKLKSVHPEIAEALTVESHSRRFTLAGE